jgi:hypothetical protein
MNIDNILASDLINHSAIAKRLYPNSRFAKQTFYQKVTGYKGRGLSAEEREAIRNILKELIK